MRLVLLLGSVVLSCATSFGCGSNSSADADPPPGVRKSEHPNTGVATSRKGKPILVDAKKDAP